jgi:hypothetical protein
MQIAYTYLGNLALTFLESITSPREGRQKKLRVTQITLRLSKIRLIVGEMRLKPSAAHVDAGGKRACQLGSSRATCFAALSSGMMSKLLQ